MNVILLAPTPPPYGGIAGWTQRMIEVNLKNNWKVVVVDEKTINRKDAYDHAHNLFDEIKRCFRIWSELNNKLKDCDSVVVQACIPARVTSMIREYVSMCITKRHKKKFIVHFRCTLPNMVKSNISLLVFKILVNNCDCVFVLNSASENFMKKHAPKVKSKVIPNFVESYDIKEKKIKNKNLERLIYVGGVNEEKGCGLIAEVAKKFPNKKFILIGSVHMDISKFPSNVVCKGEQPKNVVKKELEKADAFIFLTRYSGEGFSNALTEAMSHALPCIVSNWAANADMIEDKGGIVLEKYNVDNVVNAINSLECLDIRNRMGKWNQDKVLSKYSDKVITDLYVENYESLLKGNWTYEKN